MKTLKSLMLAASLLPASAFAGLITYQFEGTFTSKENTLNSGFDVADNLSFSGSFTYDPDAPGNAEREPDIAHDENQNTFWSVSDLTLRFGDILIEKDPDYIPGNTALGVHNDTWYWDDEAGLNSQMDTMGFSMNYDSTPFEQSWTWMNKASTSLRFFDDTATALSEPRVPDLIELADWSKVVLEYEATDVDTSIALVDYATSNCPDTWDCVDTNDYERFILSGALTKLTKVNDVSEPLGLSWFGLLALGGLYVRRARLH